MTILIESYKNEHTITEYYGHVINDVEQINYNPHGNYLNIYTKTGSITAHLKLTKRLEIYEDGE